MHRLQVLNARPEMLHFPLENFGPAQCIGVSLKSRHEVHPYCLKGQRAPLQRLSPRQRGSEPPICTSWIVTY